MNAPAKTSTQRAADYANRQKALGRKEIRHLWAHPEDHQPIRDAAAKLARRRERAVKKGNRQ